MVRFIDFKCDLSGEQIYFEKSGLKLEIGGKLGGGAYGDVFRAYLVDNLHTGLEQPAKKRSIEPKNRSYKTASAHEFCIRRVSQLDTRAINSLDSTRENFDSNKYTVDMCVPSNPPKRDADFAIKYFKDDSVKILKQGLTSATIRELSIMKSCEGHPNILKVIDIFVDPHPNICKKLNAQLQTFFSTFQDKDLIEKEFSFYPFAETQPFVLALYEYCKGGDLSKQINKCNRQIPQQQMALQMLHPMPKQILEDCIGEPCRGMPIQQVKWYSFQLLNGLAYLHNLKIEHRDLKPNNLMLDSNDKFAVLKIGDWGLGRENRSLDGTVTPTVCTLYYRPIEIILGSINLNKNRNDILIDGAQTQIHSYGLNSDIWSAACIIAEMVTGQPLFQGHSDFQVLTRIVMALGKPTENEWKNCSLSEHYPFRDDLYNIHVEDKMNNLRVALFQRMDDLGLDLLLKMLEYNPHKRITAQMALSHPWFADVNFRKLDSLGVINCYSNALKAKFGVKTVEYMEERCSGITTTTLLSHVMHRKDGVRDSVVDVIEGDFLAAYKTIEEGRLPIAIQQVQ